MYGILVHHDNTSLHINVGVLIGVYHRHVWCVHINLVTHLNGALNVVKLCFELQINMCEIILMHFTIMIKIM